MLAFWKFCRSVFLVAGDLNAERGVVVCESSATIAIEDADSIGIGNSTGRCGWGSAERLWSPGAAGEACARVLCVVFDRSAGNVVSGIDNVCCIWGYAITLSVSVRAG